MIDKMTLHRDVLDQIATYMPIATKVELMKVFDAGKGLFINRVNVHYTNADGRFMVWALDWETTE